LFIGGTFTTNTVNGNVVGQVTRTISVKQGTTIFFPLINSEADNILTTPHLGGSAPPNPKPLGVPQLQAIATAQVDAVTNLNCTLTPTDQNYNAAGIPVNLAITRLVSGPFNYKLPDTDNVVQSFGINISGTVAPAVSDGYYSSLPSTLAPGY